MIRTRFLSWLAAACMLLGVGCFELSPPVQERVTVAFQPDGSAELTLEVSIANPEERFTRNDPAKQRIAEARALYESGRDPWTRRFEAISWTRETLTWEKAGGGIVQLRRTGRLKDPNALVRFFFDVPLAVSYTRGEGFAEFTLVPQAPARASRQEREEVARLRESLARDARAYLYELSGLYLYLADHPGRERACFGEIYEECTGKEAKAGLPALLAEEEAQLDRLGEAMGRLADCIQVPTDSERSPDELARWVLDPFPAPLTVIVPGEILEAEGFEEVAPGRAGHPGLDLWFALGKLDGAYLTPDPLVPLLTCLREEKTAVPLSLESVAAQPRRSGPVPSEAELEKALDAALAPAPLYRVRWRTE
jgi:hypothetical protein